MSVFIKGLLYKTSLSQFQVIDDPGRIYQNCKFHDPQGWGSDVRRGHISHHSEYVLSSTLSIYSTLIAIVLRFRQTQKTEV